MEPQLRALHVFDQESIREELATRPDSERGYAGWRGSGCGFVCLAQCAQRGSGQPGAGDELSAVHGCFGLIDRKLDFQGHGIWEGFADHLLWTDRSLMPISGFHCNAPKIGYIQISSPV
jgi:hypothetical protein